MYTHMIAFIHTWSVMKYKGIDVFLFCFCLLVFFVCFFFWRGRTWTDMDGHGRTWAEGTDVDGRGRTWTDMDGRDGRGRTWTDVDGHGRTWTDVDGLR